MVTNNAWNSQNPAQVALGGTGVATLTGVLLGAGTSAVTGLTGNSAVIASNSSGTFAARAFSVVQQVFTSSGTYTPTTGMLYCEVVCLGSGGAGGGGPTTGAATFSGGAGGGGGEYAVGVFSAITIGASQTVTIGNAGTGVSGTTGGSGAAVSLGALITANGGAGGTSAAATAASSVAAGAAGGTGGTGGSYRSNGFSGGNCNISPVGQTVLSGNGGNSQIGSGGIGRVASGVGNNASLYGAGGGGAYNSINTAATVGGDGSKGIIVVTEYVIA